MRRYPESNLKGEITKAEMHPTVPTVTILRVRMTEGEFTPETHVHIFDSVMPPEEMVGMRLRADALSFPAARREGDEGDALLAMEWCLHGLDDEVVKCSPGWSEHETAPTIRIEPPQA